MGRKMKHHKVARVLLCLLALGLIILLIVAFVVSLKTGKSFDECFFGACCGSLYVLGVLLGFTYKEICVIVNIYLEAAVCLLSALWVTLICIKSFHSQKTWGRMILMLLGIVYGLIYVIAFLWLCHHYAMPMSDAFDLCYRELLDLAKSYHTTYNNVNYVIFILFFLVCTLGNMALAKMINASLFHQFSEPSAKSYNEYVS